jgi:hypothetical protein
MVSGFSKWAGSSSREDRVHKADAASKVANRASGAVEKKQSAGYHTNRESKVAGEAHLKAAKAHEALGHEGAARDHRERAAEHAKEAGGDWDESKHPRGPDGKFT